VERTPQQRILAERPGDQALRLCFGVSGKAAARNLNFLSSVKVKRRTPVGPDPVGVLIIFQSPSHFACDTLIEVSLYRK
jgi:hypothetical protein